jgi:hypothetical protein
MTGTGFQVEGEPQPTAGPGTLTLLSIRWQQALRCCRGLAKVFMTTSAVYTDYQYAYKDKEISDGCAASVWLTAGISPTVLSAKWWKRWSASCAAHPRTAAPLLCHGGQMAPADGLPTGTATPPRCRNESLPGPTRMIALDAYRAFAPEMAAIAKRFFEGRWMTRPARGQITRRSRSDRAVGTPYPMNYQGKA